MRVPVPVLALLAVLVALVGLGITLGESVVGHIVPTPHRDAGPDRVGEGDHSTGPGGLAVASQGYVLRPRARQFAPDELINFRFNIFTTQGQPVTAFTPRGNRRMHLVVVRRDITGYQHLYPIMEPDGTWTVPLRFDEPGSYRAFAEFVPETVATPVTLGVDLEVPGFLELGPITKLSTTAVVGGYTVIWTGNLIGGSVSRIWMHVTRDDVPITDLDPYLGSGGHAIVLREGDLAYLRVRPVEGPRQDTSTAFDVEVPTAGYHRIFLEFQHRGQVRTAAFTALAR
ncbi:MAG: hypothetical protein ACRDRG_15600 [Pseudonocardiaceae bacterium]